MWKINNSKMHDLSEIGPNVPAFLIKLWKLVNSPETDDLICWSESGLSFIINNPSQFSRELLSQYYKHNNLASFIRQLNMYGFHKVVSDIGGLRNDNKKYKDCMEFAHPCFNKDHPYLLENIKRKLPNPKPGVISNDQLNSNIKNGNQPEILAKVLSDVNNLKGRQETWDAKLAAMKRENEALWRELAVFRQKHLKQEQIINRLIHFIVTIVQPSRNVPLRKRYPLMLSDIQPVKKITKLSGADTATFNQGSPSGPIIHEIDPTDVLFGSPKQNEASGTDADFSDSPKFVEVASKKLPESEEKLKVSERIPENWLEIELTEDDVIDPLTPIDPAKVNPAVAAATIKHFESSSSKDAVSSDKVSSLTLTEVGETNEKPVTYLTAIKESGRKKSPKSGIVLKIEPDKTGKIIKKPTVLKIETEKGAKKNAKKFTLLKLDTGLKNSDTQSNVTSPDSSTSDSLLELVTKAGQNANKGTKRKATSSPTKGLEITPIPEKMIKTAESNACVPELNLDDLDFILTSKKSKEDPTGSRGTENLDESSTNSSDMIKLQSFLDGDMNEANLVVTSPGDESVDIDFLQDADKKAPTPNSDDIKKESSKEKTEGTDEVLDFDPDSMAIVCQNPSSESVIRELSSHVDTTQGELDYLKEMLKGEGYNFDANTLPWLFTDDPLSYGVLPTVDDEDSEKKNVEPGVLGNELMTYGSPNLMDLVDMIGSTPISQDWANVLSPATTSVQDLVTPAPSPKHFNFPSSSKQPRKV